MCFKQYFLKGAVIPQAAVVHDTEATAMDWQPNGRILAVGWADGKYFFVFLLHLLTAFFIWNHENFVA